MPTHKLTPNIPETITVKYSDIVPGEYGAQVRLKGKINGADVVVYLPGKIEEVVSTLFHAGLITTIPTELEPEKAVTLPLTRKVFAVCASLPAGQKHPTLTLPDAPGAPVPAAASTAVASAAPPVAHPAAAPSTSAAGRVLVTLYDECLKTAYRKCQKANEMENARFEFTASEVCAMAATLFIEANKRGLTTLAGGDAA